MVAAALAGVLAGVWFEPGIGVRIVLPIAFAIAFSVALFLWLSQQQNAFAEGDPLTAWGLQRHSRLEVQRAVPDVAVRELFEPSFIVWCAEQEEKSWSRSVTT
jgi:hypothetical protein